MGFIKIFILWYALSLLVAHRIKIEKTEKDKTIINGLFIFNIFLFAKMLEEAFKLII